MLKKRLKNIIFRIVPDKYILSLIKPYLFFKKYVDLLIYRGSRYKCSFCKNSFSKLYPRGLSLKVLEEKKVVGGGYRENSICPFCKSFDRERLIHLFINQNDLLFPGMKLLHVAPEKNLQDFFKNENLEYFSADLNSELASIKMDIQDIQFDSSYFDAVVCNHVLEHVADDRKAIGEFYRVLKPGGWAILQAPYSLVLKETLEDASITSKEERKKIFGQENHVRMYSKDDYVQRLQLAGFKVDQESLDEETVGKYALNPDELIFFCKK